MRMKKNVMLEMLINHYCDGNKAQFAAKLGIKPQTISMWLNRCTYDSELIFTKCESVSGDWLLGGEGSMTKDTITPDNRSVEFSDNSPLNEETLLLRDEILRLKAENNILKQVVGIRAEEHEIKKGHVG